MKDVRDRLIARGTTTIGVVCTEGVILASDTRVTMGFFVAHKKGKKIQKIDEHIAMTISGVVADAQRAVDILKINSTLYRITHKRPFPVRSASRLLANVMFYSRPLLLTQAIVGGVDDTGSRIFTIDPFGSVVEEKCVATGSGSPIAYGVLEDGYSENTSIKEMLPTVLKAIHSAMKRDAVSGDSFDLVKIDEDGYREFSDEEKAKLMQNL